MKSVLTAHKTALEESDEQFYDRFRTILQQAFLTAALKG